MSESRTRKIFLNARVNLIFYFLTLIISFFSRKIFLDNLGDDFIGLTGTLYNILGFLNLAELGIGTTIAVILYKPIYDKDTKAINEIVSVFGYIYNVIGKFILVVSTFISLFLPLIFEKSGMPLGIVYFAFYSFLFSSLLSYFINYKQIVLSADQRNYVVTGYYQTAQIIKNLSQLVICYYSKNYYLWVAIELLFGIVYSIILNYKIKQVYPWLSSDLKLGKKVLKKYPEIVTKTKQVFIQKLAYTVLTQTTQPIIYAFSSLQMVTFYGNYTMIIERLCSLVNMTMSSSNAAIGNLIAEGNKDKILEVFWELRAFRYWSSFILVFSFYYLMEPFICLWLGSEYVLDKVTFCIILINIFIGLTRNVVMSFLNGYGLFKDVWSSITEAIINVITAVTLGYLWGMKGVLLGTTVSLGIIIGLWKPYFLFKEGFAVSVKKYWNKTLRYIFLSFGIWLSMHYWVLPFININPKQGYFFWVLYAIVIVSLYSISSWIAYYYFCTGMKGISVRMKNFILLKQYK